MPKSTTPVGKAQRTAKTSKKAPIAPKVGKRETKKAEKDVGGRPSLYKPEFDEQARKLCLLGSTDKDLADFFEVCEATINTWKIEHPKFLESIKKGKAQADADVADRLYQRAMGFEHPDVHLSNFQGHITETPITKVYAPDPTAAIFWLKNRQKDKWRDKQELDLRAIVTTQTEEQRLARIAELQAKLHGSAK